MIADPDAVRETIANDLYKPIFSAAWTGLILSSLEGMPKNKKIVLFTILVLAGVAYFTYQRVDKT